MSYLNVIKGMSPVDLIDIAYNKIEFDRYSLGYEQKKIFSIEANYNIKKKLDLGVNLNYIEWTNISLEDSNLLNRFYFVFSLKYNSRTFYL